MKKYIFAILLSAVQFTAVAQTVNIHLKNGQTIEYPSEDVDYVDFSAKPSAPTLTAGQVVDLGLSVYWASCNLGAENPEEYGNFYAWGEINTKTDFNPSLYTGGSFDTAKELWGNDWTVPSASDFEELMTQCTWTTTTRNGVKGSEVQGPNGNTIFLPWSGWINSTLIMSRGSEGIYWSSTLDGDGARELRVGEAIWDRTSGIPWIGTDGLSGGRNIRPVTSNPNAGGAPIDHSQDHLVTEKVSASFLGGSIMKINNTIQGSSVLNVMIKNGSSENITLVGIQMNDAANGYTGNNALGEEVEIPAGESKSYGITLGRNMTTPVICFTYRYNNKKYTAEATWNN